MKNSRLTLTILAALALASGSSAMAANSSWTGGSGTQSWSAAGNWSGGTVPGNVGTTTDASVATFNTATAGTSVTIDSTRNIGSITFATSAGSYTIGSAGVNAGNSLLLSNGGVISIATGFTGQGIAETINAPLVIEGATTSTAGSYSFTNNALSSNNDALSFAGNISSGTSSTVTLNLNGTNAQAINTISGAISNNGASAFSLVVGGTSTWLLSGNNSGMTGGTISVNAGSASLVNGATLLIGSNNALGSDAVNFVAGTGSSSNFGAVGNVTVSNNFTGNSTSPETFVGSGNLTINGTFTNVRVTNPSIYNFGTGTLTFGGSFNLQSGATNANFQMGGPGNTTFSGAIYDSSQATLTGTSTNFIKLGSGTVTISGSYVATGQFYDSGGTLVLDTSSVGTRLPNAALSLGGVTLNLSGTGGSNQTVAGTTIRLGQTTIQDTNSGTSFIKLGAISGSTGGLANFGSGAATTSTANANGILGASYTVGGTDWAVGNTASTPISAYTGYTTFTGTASSSSTNYLLTGSGTIIASTTIQQNTLKINSTTGSSQSLALGSGSVYTAIGLLYVGSDAYSITGGTVNTTQTQLIIQQWGSGTLTIGSSIADRFNTVINLVKGGTGTLVLSGANAYTGETYINDGTVSISSDTNLGGQNTVSVTSSATGTTTVTLAASAPDLVVGSSFLGTTVAAISGTVVTLTANANQTISSSTAVGFITSPTNMTLVLDGGTLSASGSFSLAETLGAQTVNRSVLLAANGGTLDVTGGNTLTVAGVIGNATNTDLGIGTFTPFGALTKTGLGTLVLSGTNTYTGGTTVTGGTLQLGNATALGSSIGALSVSNGTVDLNGFNASVHGVTLGGTATIAATSSGTLTSLPGMTVNNAGNAINSGATVVAAVTVNGALKVSGVVAGAVSVAGTGTLGGTGTTGAVTVAGGGNINLTDGLIGTLTVGGLTTGGGTASVLTFEIGSSAGSIDQIQDNGILTVNGGTTNISIADLSGGLLATGTYDLINYTGALTGTLSNFNLLTTSLDSKTLSLTSLASGELVLTVSASSTPAVAYFNGNTSGDLNTASNFYTTASGTAVISSAVGATTDVVITANSGGSNVLLPTLNSGNLTINSLTLTGSGTPATSAVTLNGTSTLTINGTTTTGSGGINTAPNGIIVQTGAGNDTINVPIILGNSQTWTVTDSGNTLTVNGNISGSGDMLTKAGAGKLVLTGTNTYSGGTTITAGTLQIGNGGSTGTIGGGAISNSGTLVFDLTTNYNLTNNISGNGAITDIGSGILTLSGTNSSTGATTVTTGTLSVGSAGSLSSGLVSLANGTALQYSGGTGTLAQNITVTSGSATINNTGTATLTLSGTLTKADSNLILNAGGHTIDVTGRIVSTGAGGAFDSDLYITNGTTIVDNSNNTYSGPTHVYGNGTMVNGFNNALPTNTIVELGNSDATAAESGASFTNIYQLNGHNQSIAGLTSTNPAGFTDVNSVVGGNGTLSTLTLTGTGTGSLPTETFGSNSITNGNNLAVKFNTSNAVTLTGSNTYTGGTEIVTGTLVVTNPTGSATGTGSLLVDSGATLQGKGTINSTNNTLSAGSKVIVGSGGSNTTDVLTMTASGTTNFSGASLTFNLDAASTNSNSVALLGTPNVLFGSGVTTLTLNLLGTSTTNIANGTDYILFSATSGSQYSDLSIVNGKITNFNLVLTGTATNGQANSIYYQNSYLILSGGNIDIQVVPEPGTWVLMLGGLALLAIVQRARRKNS